MTYRVLHSRSAPPSLLSHTGTNDLCNTTWANQTQKHLAMWGTFPVEEKLRVLHSNPLSYSFPHPAVPHAKQHLVR